MTHRQDLQLRLRNLTSAIDALERGAAVDEDSDQSDVCRLLYSEQAAVRRQLALAEHEAPRDLAVKRMLIKQRLAGIKAQLNHWALVSLSSPEQVRKRASLIQERARLSERLKELGG